MKKTMTLLILACMLLLVGCSQIGIDTGDEVPAVSDTPQDTPADTPEETPAEPPQETPEATPSPTGESAAPGSALTEDDFRIVADGIEIAIGADPSPVFDAFGEAITDLDNGEGFYIHVNTDAAGASVITHIILRGMPTARGITTGDSYEDILAQYGEPDEENSDEGMTYCYYRSGARTIVFGLNPQDMLIYFMQIE